MNQNDPKLPLSSDDLYSEYRYVTRLHSAATIP